MLEHLASRDVEIAGAEALFAASHLLVRHAAHVLSILALQVRARARVLWVRVGVFGAMPRVPWELWLRAQGLGFRAYSLAILCDASYVIGFGV